MNPILSRLRLEPLEDRTLLATCHVTRLSDTGAGMGFRGDLRYCINKVNAEPGPDKIDFHVTGTINLSGALPDLASDMDIEGPGKDLLVVRRNTADPYRIFTIAGGTVRIAGLTVQNGSEAVGGGIYNQGELLLDDVAVSFNASPQQGGGIYNAGRLEIYNSLIDNNRVEATVAPTAFYIGGGGIYNVGDLAIENSHIAANFAFSANYIAGGGLHNAEGGTATVRYSTISDNDSESTTGFHGASYSYGGGIYTAGVLSLQSSAVIRNNATDQPNGGAFALALGGGIHSTCNATSTLVFNSTIAENGATSSEHSDTSAGGGIYAHCPGVIVKNSTISKNFVKASEVRYGGGVSGDLYIYNSIVADNSASQFSQYGHDFVGTLNGSGHNVFGNSNGGYGFADSDLLNVDPMLAPLGYNGGPTLTMALLPGSPAINAGINTFDAPEFDQRGPGFPRIVNGTIDIGAFEVQTTPVPSVRNFWMFLITADAKADDASAG